MSKKVRSIKTPNYLAKHILYLIISGALFLFLLFNVIPNTFYTVIAFLVLVFIVSSNLIALILFLIWYKNEVRVWYLKNESFEKIFRRSTYFSLFITLLLFLRYVGQFNTISILVLCILITVFALLNKKRRSL